MLVALNDFVRRQTAESRFSHFNGSEEELLALATEALEDNGLTEELIGLEDTRIETLKVNPAKFMSGITKLTHKSVLTSTYEARRKGEEAVLVTTAKGDKIPAVEVSLVLYHHNTLKGDASTDAEWELVSINASIVAGGEPMTPATMTRNMSGAEGGTKVEYTAAQFMEAITFWNNHAMITPEEV